MEEQTLEIDVTASREVIMAQLNGTKTEIITASMLKLTGFFFSLYFLP